jgi:response regulator RpfG family c-di-GMP phosphodiesterase
VKSVAVARKLGVTKPSVARAIGILTEKGLVDKEHYGKISITDEGKRVARQHHEQIRQLSACVSGSDPQPDVIPGLFHDLIQSIVSALEARDPRTAEHSMRVGEMTEKTCLLMELSQQQTVGIHMAAHVHDIGKIGIPDSTLLKRERLNAEEHAILRNHPQIGADILGSCPSLGDVAQIVLHHHERWDGSGYPHGLAGKDIPLGSRIIMVCDSIDAMLGKRVCCKFPIPDRCRQEIINNAGTIYDPLIALFVVQHWDEIVKPVEFKGFVEHDPRTYRKLHCSVPLLMDFNHSA